MVLEYFLKACFNIYPFAIVFMLSFNIVFMYLSFCAIWVK